MIKNNPNSLAISIVIIFGVALFFIGTDGFQAYTVETARVNKLMEENPVFPEVTLEDSKERVYPFKEFEGKYVMLTFIYTACTDVCPELELNMAQVYNNIPEQYIGEDIVFLSISFDPERDDPATLEKYRSYFNSDGEIWRMARIEDQSELDDLLDEFGVIVIPDKNGNFQHNSAFYLVDPNGILVEVMDYTEIEGATEKIISILETELEE
ncbi:SCO family protein [Oceanobacillus longus]|uniref:SCO family protein n=1 Tax=Oceanobacillus longus TaxID=930120 RepID=A0ABV8GXE0_9BACI